jgi:hypothetical protein
MILSVPTDIWRYNVSSQDMTAPSVIFKIGYTITLLLFDFTDVFWAADRVINER